MAILQVLAEFILSLSPTVSNRALDTFTSWT